MHNFFRGAVAQSAYFHNNDDRKKDRIKYTR